eukprot:6843827-Pyramimonas_sp.AAC.1
MSELALLPELGPIKYSCSANLVRKDDDFFDVTRAADELHSCLVQTLEERQQKRCFSVSRRLSSVCYQSW